MTTQEQVDQAFNAFWMSTPLADCTDIHALAKLAFVAGMCAGNQQALDIMRTKDIS